MEKAAAAPPPPEPKLNPLKGELLAGCSGAGVLSLATTGVLLKVKPELF